jgi:hypothetical protein
MVSPEMYALENIQMNFLGKYGRIAAIILLNIV